MGGNCELNGDYFESKEEILTLCEKLFHAYDIRSDSTILTDTVVERLIKAFAYYLKENKHTTSVVIARDCRLSGGRILEKSISILLSLDFTVLYYPSPISTPLFYFSAIKNPNCAGIMITASHNPGYYNGFKLVNPSCMPISKNKGNGELDIIERYFILGLSPERGTNGEAKVIDYRDDYISFALSYLGIERLQLKDNIIFDFLSGSASTDIPYLLNKLGIKCRTRNYIPNGAFPSGEPNPIIEESIKDTKEEMKSGLYSFALLYDGDGDRFDVLDKQGREIPPSVIFSFILPYLSRRQKNKTVCFDTKVSPVILSYVKEEGYHTYLTPTGHSRIKEILHKERNNGFILAVEESGHYYFNYEMGEEIYSTENTLLVTLSFLLAISQDKSVLEELQKRMSQINRIREFGFFFKDGNERDNALSLVKAAFVEDGFTLIEKQENGEDLLSTLLQKGMGEEKKEDWIQLSQRKSESEMYLARWEILSNKKEDGERVKDKIIALLSPWEGRFYIG